MSEPTEKVNIKDPIDADDDLDELDDVLSEFTPASAPANASGSVKPSFGRKRTNTRVDQAPVSIPGSGTAPGGAPVDPASKAEADLLSDEFTKELAKNMEQLMKELVIDNSSEKKDDHDEKDDEAETQKMFKAAWEAMLIEGMNGMVPEGLDATPTTAAGSSDKASTSGGNGEGFQSRIKQTMDKLKENESSLKPDSASTPDSLEQLLASLGDLGLDGDDNELDGLLENVMGQIMSKEILYPPLKELAENFPPYLARPPEPITPEDKTRYEAQLASVKKILAVFDKPNYDDKDPAASKRIVSLMEELQSHGSPPEAVMGPLPPGMNFGADGMPEGCTIA